MSEVRATSILDLFELKFFHQLTNEIFSRVSSKEASVDKCIKCSKKFSGERVGWALSC